MTSEDLRVVTYSPAITLVPTYECFNRCLYCNFRVDPGQDSWLPLAEAAARSRQASAQGAIEALILSGEVHPHSPRRSQWFQHIYDICNAALENGLLPHTNAGPLSYEEMAQLKAVNVSMGLMLEQVTPTLLAGVHRHAPSKVPAVRLQQLHWAGELQIPFTTGLLLGIGESPEDRIETLRAIARCHDRWGHIQEVILQPHQGGQRQAYAAEGFSPEALLEVITLARNHLPAEITVQIPPNLVASPSYLLRAIAAGARDLGGIGSIDEVNPDYPQRTPGFLRHLLGTMGWILAPRLPLHPRYDPWLDPSMQQSVARWRQQHKPLAGQQF